LDDFATVEPTADQTGGGQISDGNPAIVEPTAYQTGGVQISDGSFSVLLTFVYIYIKVTDTCGQDSMMSPSFLASIFFI
jgi:hypothetical protein